MLSIVLVNTQLPENIGASARAMMNFGLSDLRLVAPREEWPNKRAYDLAGHAGPILDSARIFATTREAVADMSRVYAATARSREMVKSVFTPNEGMELIRREALPTAILFGPERSGLTNDDVSCADAIITIPTASTLASLNIGQSVVVLAYQWLLSSRGAAVAQATDEITGSQARDPALLLRSPQDDVQKGTTGPNSSPVVHKSAFATKEEIQVLLDHLERELDAVDFWKVADKKPKMWLNLRNIFTRASLTEQEVRTLHGVIACLKEGK
jgi:tRNA/rRNA methyltransferase